MSDEIEDGGNLLQNLPAVPLRKVLGMLGKDDKKRLRLVSKRWMKTVWQHDKKFRFWMVNEGDIDEHQLPTLLHHPNYEEYQPHIVVWIHDSFEDLKEKLKPLKHRIVGFKLFNGNLCKDLIGAEYKTLERLAIEHDVYQQQFLPKSQYLLKLIQLSSSTLVSLDLAKVDLSIFTDLQENFSTLDNLKISRCVNEKGLATLLKCSRASLKSLKFYECTKLNLTDMAKQLEPFSRVSELEIMYGPRVPARFIDLCSSSLKYLMIGHIETNLKSLLTLKNKLPALTTLYIDFCIIGEDLKGLMTLAPSISKFRLEGCMKEDSKMWKIGSFLKNVKEVTLNTSSNSDMEPGNTNYEMPDVVNLVYKQCHNYLTCLKLEGVDISLLDAQPGDLPCLKELNISDSYKEDVIFDLLIACQSSIEILVLHGESYIEFQGFKLPKLRKLVLRHNLSSIIECAPNLEDLTLIVERLIDLNGVPPNLKVKKLQINTHGQIGEGYEFLWICLAKMSATLESLYIILVTPYYSNTRIKIDIPLKMPHLTFLNIFGFFEAAPALLKTCSESLVHFKVSGRDSSWVNRLKCNLPKLRRAHINPAPQAEHMEYFKKRCYSTSVIKTKFEFESSD